jgi:predicted membrane channel-forming protein YqfA (hemolysin III family)
VPVTAVAGVPGILAGVLLDESVVTRAVFAVGGTMYMVGATTYALINPQDGGQVV